MTEDGECEKRRENLVAMLLVFNVDIMLSIAGLLCWFWQSASKAVHCTQFMAFHSSLCKDVSQTFLYSLELVQMRNELCSCNVTYSLDECCIIIITMIIIIIVVHIYPLMLFFVFNDLVTYSHTKTYG